MSAHADIQQLVGQIGGTVYVLGTKRRKEEKDHGTHQTPGISDLVVFLPRRGRPAGEATEHLVFIEVKSETGELSPAQDAFRAHALAAHVSHVVGTYQDFIDWLIVQGFVREQSLPHYRVRQVPA
jgi:hypothetical protein